MSTAVKLPRTEETKQRVIAALREHGGNISAVARVWGVTRVAMWRYIREDPDLCEAEQSAGFELCDTAIQGLRTLVEKGDKWAIDFVLTKSPAGKALGWGANVTAVTASTTTLEVVEEIVDGKPTTAATSTTKSVTVMQGDVSGALAEPGTTVGGGEVH